MIDAIDDNIPLFGWMDKNGMSYTDTDTSNNHHHHHNIDCMDEIWTQYDAKNSNYNSELPSSL